VEVLRALDLVPQGADVADVVNEYVEVDPKLFRTGEIHDLLGDATMARRDLNWQPEVDFRSLVRMMVASDAGVEVASVGSARGQFATPGA